MLFHDLILILGKPKLPKTSNPALVIAFPRDQEKDEDEIVWLMANSMDDLKLVSPMKKKREEQSLINRI